MALSLQEGRAAAETLASMLSTYGSYAWHSGNKRAIDIGGLCRSWAEKVLLASPNLRPVLHGGATSSKREACWGALGRFFAECRAIESESFEEVSRQLGESIREFCKLVSEAQAQHQTLDVAVVTELDRVNRALDGQNADELVVVARSLVARLESSQVGRKACSEKQRESLTARLRALETGGVLQSGLYPLDPVTRLYQVEEFEQHLSFLSAIGSLISRPPILHVFEVSSEDGSGTEQQETLMLALADQLVRVFFAVDQFVARPAPCQFAVVTAGLEVHQAHTLTQQAHEQLRQITRELSAVTVASIAGEEPLQWWERAKQGASEASAYQASLLQLPAVFELD